jgi:hypothetical protein
MSDSPPKAQEEEHGAQSAGEGEEPMDGQPTAGDGDGFDVKEQDRWLPIANGSYYFVLAVVFFTCDLCAIVRTLRYPRDNAGLPHGCNSTRIPSHISSSLWRQDEASPFVSFSSQDRHHIAMSMARILTGSILHLLCLAILRPHPRRSMGLMIPLTAQYLMLTSAILLQLRVS